MQSLRVVLVIAMAAGASVARADSVDPKVRILPSVNGQPPRIEAMIPGLPRAPIAYAINAVGGAQIAPLEVRSQRAGGLPGPQPVAIALVYCGQMIWIGNSDYATEAGASYYGALKGIERALDHAELGKHFPDGSVATAISYSVGSAVELPMGPLEKLDGRALGDQKHYEGRIGSDLVLGVRAGLDALEQVSVTRRLLVIIGDGSDTNGDERAQIQLHELADRAQDMDVQIVAIVYKSEVSPGSDVIGALTSNVLRPNSVDGIRMYLEAVPRLHERHYVVFPTIDPNTGVSLPLDGTLHDIELHVGDQRTKFPFAVNYSPPTSDFPIKSAIGVAGLVALLASLGFYLRTRRLVSASR